ncbi:threonine/serine exporter family protein [Vibrio sp. WXL103]|uniref:threonine/serine exporter family protein n=1 Tax=Vibrio sp. WXL103 TaxID=3450710 RepID=UPI003EC8A129
MMTLIFALFEDMLLASIPAIGFAMLFNVPQRALFYCALGGALGHGSRFLLLEYGVPIEWATFVAATIVSVIGIYWSQRFLAHPKVFTVAAMIPMVPGVYAFKAMIALIEIQYIGYSEPLMAMLVENFLAAIFIITALAVGLALPGLIFYRRKPIV